MGILKNNIVIGIIALILVSIGGAYYLLRTPTTEDLLVSENVDDSAVGRELLASLLTLKSLKFDKALFEDSTFKSFLDFSVEIPDEPHGRPNPFYPIGYDGAGVVVPDEAETDGQ
ncbi:MAG: hypothetical protein AAB840_02480 [Patescibacteria group bacterium]